jgi:hypothetical protein
MRDGTIPYVNTFGVNLNIPRFHVLDAGGYISSKMQDATSRGSHLFF